GAAAVGPGLHVEHVAEPPAERRAGEEVDVVRQGPVDPCPRLHRALLACRAARKRRDGGNGDRALQDVTTAVRRRHGLLLPLRPATLSRTSSRSTGSMVPSRASVARNVDSALSTAGFFAYVRGPADVPVWRSASSHRWRRSGSTSPIGSGSILAIA